ncbi:MAG: hypothetical protein A3K19_02160 [Lentisphaerae bacterium RIFOXYB12_FULL_65_16]|nr:MAG: hypothetical protein A3K18_12860 [Lentisphaerae bacterium RIFOXYA12_64_32]OGV94000.1 MAG: hypothetical protein A3K19_02160 [Lentisphaerae bacterium RIFOXYB12_FULL_65_16]
MRKTWNQALAKALTRPPQLRGLQTYRLDERWARVMHRPKAHELVHVLDGRGTIVSPRGECEVTRGDTFVILRGTPHRDAFPVGLTYSVLYVFFDWPGAEPLLRHATPERLRHTPATAKTLVHHLIKELESEYLGERPDAESRLQLVLLEVLLCLVRHSQPAAVPAPRAKVDLALERRRRLAQQTLEYLREHFNEPIHLENLAQFSGVSTFHLCRAFSQEMGMTMTDLLTSLRIEKAKELLRAGDVPIKEIADSVGFADANYFAKVFRKSTGEAPSAFQARVMEDGR